jgi:hypothetical protein
MIYLSESLGMNSNTSALFLSALMRGSDIIMILLGSILNMVDENTNYPDRQ